MRRDQIGRGVARFVPLLAVGVAAIFAVDASASTIYIGLQGNGNNGNQVLYSQDTASPGAANLTAVPQGSTVGFGAVVGFDGSSIYYVNHDSNAGNSFYSSNTDGSNIQVIATNAAKVSTTTAMVAGAGTVYVGTTANGIQTLSESASNPSQVQTNYVSGVGNVAGMAYDFADNFVFSIDTSGNLYGIATANKQVTKLTNTAAGVGSGGAISIDTVDQLVFYADSNTSVHAVSYTITGNAVTFGSQTTIATATEVTNGGQVSIGAFRGMGYDYSNNELFIGDSGKPQVYDVADANSSGGSTTLATFDTGINKNSSSSNLYGGLAVDSVAGVPEPASIAICALGFCGLLARRRRA
ncbi:MAG TPA: PEP-CTERM sorting domain-containing protein [Tepidisphaeraceae bacterium]|nr:PEP-CTERM sorting domain-containing protein [Tepidisphaeraceae bacterium]